MNEELLNSGPLDRRVIRALERVPEPAIPANFAARVAGMVPARRVPVTLRPHYYGRNAMAAGMAVLLLAMFLLAIRSVPNSLLWTGLEWLLCAQFIAVGLWWAFRRGSYS